MTWSKIKITVWRLFIEILENVVTVIVKFRCDDWFVYNRAEVCRVESVIKLACYRSINFEIIVNGFLLGMHGRFWRIYLLRYF